MKHDCEYGDTGRCIHCNAVNPLQAAEEKAANALARANELKEAGRIAEAEKFFGRSARWLMRANEMRGW